MTATQKYRELIERFPLRPIKNSDDHLAALALFDELAQRENTHTPDERDYLIVLIKLIKDYEDNDRRVQAFTKGVKEVTPQEALAFLMKENGLTQTQLAAEAGCEQSTLSSFLAGRRGLSKANAARLARRFSVSVDLFMPRVDEQLAG